jgi:hypothetical protein
VPPPRSAAVALAAAVNRSEPASDTSPPQGSSGPPPERSGRGARSEAEASERSAWRALDASEFERVLARAEELEALGRGEQARRLRAEVREGLIGQMLADPTRSSAARWLGLLVRVDPDAAEEFERRARRGTPAEPREVSDEARGSEQSLGGRPEGTAIGSTGQAHPASSASPARTLPLGAPLQRCGLRLRLDGLGELGLAACEALQWAPIPRAPAPPGSRFEPGLWLASEGERALCLPLGPGVFEVLDERGEVAGVPRESLELRDGLRFRWTTPGGGPPRTLNAQGWGEVWLISISRGADLAGARRIAWWPRPGCLRLDPADTRLPLHSLTEPLELCLDAEALGLSCPAGLRPTADESGRTESDQRLGLPLDGPRAFEVGAQAWLRIEPWEQAP